jgi:uncharacterized protein YneR
MIIKNFHTIQIECSNENEYFDIVEFINLNLDTNDALWYFEEQDLSIQIEYLEDETFEKISNFLKTFNYD